MPKELHIENPFMYYNQQSMLVWKIAQTCIWMIQALWRDDSDIITIKAELKQIQEAVKNYKAYKEA